MGGAFAVEYLRAGRNARLDKRRPLCVQLKGPCILVRGRIIMLNTTQDDVVELTFRCCRSMYWEFSASRIR
jgi:hypothetical protein